MSGSGGARGGGGGGGGETTSIGSKGGQAFLLGVAIEHLDVLYGEGGVNCVRKENHQKMWLLQYFLQFFSFSVFQ